MDGAARASADPAPITMISGISPYFPYGLPYRSVPAHLKRKL
jgi:hypothetical protein